MEDGRQDERQNEIDFLVRMCERAIDEGIPFTEYLVDNGFDLKSREGEICLTCKTVDRMR